MIFNDIILPSAHTHAGKKKCFRRVINGFSSHNVTRRLRLRKNLLIPKSEAPAKTGKTYEKRGGIEILNFGSFCDEISGWIILNFVYCNLFCVQNFDTFFESFNVVGLIFWTFQRFWTQCFKYFLNAMFQTHYFENFNVFDFVV